jgi:hypothetical protein
LGVSIKNLITYLDDIWVIQVAMILGFENSIASDYQSNQLYFKSKRIYWSKVIKNQVDNHVKIQ